MRAPGVGLALVDLATRETHRGYPLDGGQQASLALAVEIARDAYGLASSEVGDAADVVRELRSDWLEFGGSISPLPFGIFPDTVSTISEIGDINIGEPHSHNTANPIDWNRIQASLVELGLIVESRHHQSALLSQGSLCSVFEIRDQLGKVLSEGKGVCESDAIKGALGEAVERLAAQLPRPDRLFVATARELTEAGFALPKFSPGHRDLYSEDLSLEWVIADTFSETVGALPAELVYYPFQPSSGIKAFSVQSTVGLAAGASVASASVAGLREAIETDAYWLSMRTRRVCATFRDLFDCSAPRVRQLVRALDGLGVATHAGLISFDWPVPIVHVVLETKSESLPALSHGLAMGVDPLMALERALLEAIQVYSGLEKVALEYWPEISVGLARSADPPIIWSDPSYAQRVVGMFDEAPPVNLSASETNVTKVSGLLEWMISQGMTPWRAHLGERHELEIVRSFIEGGVSPFSERGDPSPRVQALLAKCGLRYPYLDPVLT